MPGDHLPHHARLAELRRHGTGEACSQHHQRDDQEEHGQQRAELALLVGDEPLVELRPGHVQLELASGRLTLELGGARSAHATVPLAASPS